MKQPFVSYKTETCSTEKNSIISIVNQKGNKLIILELNISECHLSTIQKDIMKYQDA
ncbi:hypothetical protein NUSPORA_02582 [Nucleospora cyclopteri]